MSPGQAIQSLVDEDITQIFVFGDNPMHTITGNYVDIDRTYLDLEIDGLSERINLNNLDAAIAQLDRQYGFSSWGPLQM